VQLKKSSALGDKQSLALLQTMFDLNKTLWKPQYLVN
jgi:hypothetical protein